MKSFRPRRRSITTSSRSSTGCSRTFSDVVADIQRCRWHTALSLTFRDVPDIQHSKPFVSWGPSGRQADLSEIKRMSLTFRDVNQVSFSWSPWWQLTFSKIKNVSLTFREVNQVSSSCTVLQLVTLVVADLQCGQEDVPDLQGGQSSVLQLYFSWSPWWQLTFSAVKRMFLTFRKVNQVSSSCTSPGYLGGSWPSVKSRGCPWPSGRSIKRPPAVLHLGSQLTSSAVKRMFLNFRKVNQVSSSCTSAGHLGGSWPSVRSRGCPWPSGRSVKRPSVVLQLVTLVTADLQWNKRMSLTFREVNQVSSSCTSPGYLGGSWPSVKSRGCPWPSGRSIKRPPAVLHLGSQLTFSAVKRMFLNFMGSPPSILQLYCTWGHLNDSWLPVRSKGCHWHSERSIKCSLPVLPLGSQLTFSEIKRLSLTFREINQASSSCTSAGHLGSSWPSVKSRGCPWPSWRWIKRQPAALNCGSQVTFSAVKRMFLNFMGHPSVLQLYSLGVALMTSDLQWNQEAVLDLQGGQSSVLQLYFSWSPWWQLTFSEINSMSLTFREVNQASSSCTSAGHLGGSWPSAWSRGYSWTSWGHPSILQLYYCTWGHLDDSWPQRNQEDVLDLQRGQPSVLQLYFTW